MECERMNLCHPPSINTCLFVTSVHCSSEAPEMFYPSDLGLAIGLSANVCESSVVFTFLLRLHVWWALDCY